MPTPTYTLTRPLTGAAAVATVILPQPRRSFSCSSLSSQHLRAGGITRRGRVVGRSTRGHRSPLGCCGKQLGSLGTCGKTSGCQKPKPSPALCGRRGRAPSSALNLLPHSPLILSLGGPRVWAGWEGQSRDLCSKQGMCFFTGM